MAKNSIDIEVNCRMSVERGTAEGCLKIVEMFLNGNRQFGILAADNDDGTTSLYMVDYENVMHEVVRHE